MSHPTYKMNRIRRRWREEKWREEADKWYAKELRRMYGTGEFRPQSPLFAYLNKLMRKEVNTD